MSGGAKLKQLVLSGSAWSLARTGVDQVIRFAVFVTLARLLEPTDFGLFALATIFIDIGRILAMTGWSEAVIRAPEVSDRFLSTVFWSIAGTTTVAAVVIAALSFPIANLLNEPAAALILIALSAALMLGPLGAVHWAIATKEFRNRALTLTGVATSLIGSGVVVAAAFAGLGVWSFVIQQIVVGVLSAFLLWPIIPWRPSFTYDLREAKRIFGFSSNLIGAQLLQTGIVRVQDFIAGVAISPAALGQYRIAGRGYEIINQVCIMPLSAMAMPALSRLQSDPAAFGRAYTRMLSLTSAIAVPAMLGFSAVATLAIPLVFGAKWAPAIPVVQVLGLMAPSIVISYFAAPALIAYGRSDIVIRLTLIQFIGTVIFSAIAVRWGIVGLAWGYLARSYLTLPLQLFMFTRATKIRFKDIANAVLPPTFAGLSMAAVVFAAGHYGFSNVHAAIALACLFAIGAITYPLTLYILNRRFVLDQINSLRSAIGS